MDELLHDRVKQLKEIDDRLERLIKLKPTADKLLRIVTGLNSLRLELALMIAKAEQEHADF